MSHRTAKRPKKKPPEKLHVGQHVVASAGTLEGAGPMDRLIITKVHRDGTVDLEAVTGIGWVGVDPDPLLTVD